MPTNFTFRITGTGNANDTGTLYWGVRETDPLSNDNLWLDREKEITVLANGTYTVDITFYLFSKRDGSVSGPDESSGETTTDEIFVTVGTYWRNLGRTAVGDGVFAVGTANVPAGTTAGQGSITSVTATLAGPAGFDNTVSRSLSPFKVFDVTITIAGTAGAVVSNLRWSIFEADLTVDDELVYEREFTVTIGAGGTVSITRQFILFAKRGGTISGVDEDSDETSLGSGAFGDNDPVCVLIENSGGTDLFKMPIASGLYVRSTI
jgi:hypothetical protein